VVDRNKAPAVGWCTYGVYLGALIGFRASTTCGSLHGNGDGNEGMKDPDQGSRVGHTQPVPKITQFDPSLFF
jgi:hypothetical protein